MKRLVIYGAGGFGREVLTAARASGCEVAFLSDVPVSSVAQARIIRRRDLRPTDEIVIAIADGVARKRIATRLTGIGKTAFGKIIAPSVILGNGVNIGEGAILCDHSMVTASATIGRHFHANIYSYVAHDCMIGDFVTFAPKVCCNGNVHVEDGVYIGTGAIIRQGKPDRPIVIGEGAVVGAGAVVLRDVAPGSTVVGNPAKTLIKAVGQQFAA